MKEGVAVPPKCWRARLTAHHWKPRAKAIVEKMTAKGILVRMDDVAPAVSTGFFVKKPHGNGIRLVADYTGVNKALERLSTTFLLPRRSGRESPQAPSTSLPVTSARVTGSASLTTNPLFS